MIYINHFFSINPQGSISKNEVNNILNEGGEVLYLQEPSYENIIPPMQLRRMSKPIRTSVIAIKEMMKDGVQADAIVVGSAFGLLQDTESFLKNIHEHDEYLLNPTSFIQSTHNTVSGQIALMLQCTAYNMTYVHDGHSFESALQDVDLLLRDDAEQMILLGAVEELTPTSINILNTIYNFNHLFKAGEGCSFFRVSGVKSEESIAVIPYYNLSKYEENISSYFDKLRHFMPDLTGKNVLMITNEQVVFPELLDVAEIKQVNLSSYLGNYPTASAACLAYGLQYLQTDEYDVIIVMYRFVDFYSSILLQKP